MGRSSPRGMSGLHARAVPAPTSSGERGKPLGRSVERPPTRRALARSQLSRQAWTPSRFSFRYQDKHERYSDNLFNKPDSDPGSRKTAQESSQIGLARSASPRRRHALLSCAPLARSRAGRKPRTRQGSIRSTTSSSPTADPSSRTNGVSPPREIRRHAARCELLGMSADGGGWVRRGTSLIGFLSGLSQSCWHFPPPLCQRWVRNAIHKTINRAKWGCVAVAPWCINLVE